MVQSALSSTSIHLLTPCRTPLPAGYSKKVKGKTAEERLDMRAAVKADKFCK